MWRKCYGGSTSSFPRWQKNIVHILAFQKQRKENTSICLDLLLLFTFAPTATLDYGRYPLIYGKSVFPFSGRGAKGRREKGREAEKNAQHSRNNVKVPIDT